MVSLSDIRDYLQSLNAIGGFWTIGRFEAEKEKRVCVYQRPDYSTATVAIGGEESTKTYVKHIQVLIHWTQNHRETEEAAQKLYEALQFNPRPTIGKYKVSYMDLRLPEAADLGSDKSGIFERVIWLDLYFKEEKNGY